MNLTPFCKWLLGLLQEESHLKNFQVFKGQNCWTVRRSEESQKSFISSWNEGKEHLSSSSGWPWPSVRCLWAAQWSVEGNAREKSSELAVVIDVGHIIVVLYHYSIDYQRTAVKCKPLHTSAKIKKNKWNSLIACPRIVQIFGKL